MAKRTATTTARTTARAPRASKVKPVAQTVAASAAEPVLEGEVLPPALAPVLLLTHEPRVGLVLDGTAGLPAMVLEALADRPAAQEPAVVAEAIQEGPVADPVAAAAARPVKAVKKAKMEKLPTDSGRTPAEVEGNRALVRLLLARGPEGATARELADVAGFTAPITTKWVGTVAERNGLEWQVKAGPRNKYRYSVTPKVEATAGA